MHSSTLLASGPHLRKLLLAGLLIAFGAVAIDMATALKMGPTIVAGDGAQYVDLAHSLATGRGYTLEIGPWPDQPNVGRAPFWPALLAIPVWLLGAADPRLVAQCTGAVLHGVSALLLVLLTFRLTGRFWAAVGAGAMLAIYLPETGLVARGYSEVAYVAAMLAGVLLFLEDGLLPYLGAFLAGAAVLARPNYAILPFLLMALVLLSRNRKTGRLFPATATLLFCLPTAFWVARNHAVSGYFPLLSATEGETLYGGNNAVVASQSELWGYWLAPNDIPGEPSKLDLAREKTEAQVNAYYHDKGVRYVREHLAAMPRMLVGKLVRGFIPMSWTRDPFAIVVACFRFCLYSLFLLTFRFWPGRNGVYDAVVATMFLLTLGTTLVYYGSFRLTYCIEPFLFPYIAAGIAHAFWPGTATSPDTP